MKFNDIEFRYSETNKRYELIRWICRDAPNKPCCIVIAYFKKHSEGYDMVTVGDRFFEDADAFKLGKIVMQFLQLLFDNDDIEEGSE
jgi:hypothetical protein